MRPLAHALRTMPLVVLSASAALTASVFAPACTGDDPRFDGIAADGGTPARGTTCDATKPCGVGTCVDGFCCDTTCSGTCESCSLPGKEGTCSPVTGKPVRGACDGDPEGACAGSCDGNNRASCTYPETACTQPTCAGGTATLAATCKNGKCGSPETQACSIGCLEDTCLGVKQVAGGRYHACAVMTDKRVRCWGSNDYGQLGNLPDTVPTPTELADITNAEMVAAIGGGTTCILLSDKTVRCMGANTSGQLGLGTVDSNVHKTPTPVPGLTDVTFIAGGSGSHFCAITTGGTLKCWGSNYDGQIGDGTFNATPRSSPTTVCQPNVPNCAASSGAKFVVSGDNHTCAVFADDKVACWGGNDAGALGQDPATTPRNPTPTFVPGLTATYLTAGNRVTCAASEGSAKCFGSNGLGILGNATAETQSFTPSAVCTKADCSTKLAGVTGVATFDESACAVANGAVKCWGTNSGGQLGDGNSSTSQGYAATSAIASGAVYVTSVGSVNMAIVVDRADRTLRCWGSEFGNECGSGQPAGERRTPLSPRWNPNP